MEVVQIERGKRVMEVVQVGREGEGVQAKRWRRMVEVAQRVVEVVQVDRGGEEVQVEKGREWHKVKALGNAGGISASQGKNKQIILSNLLYFLKNHFNQRQPSKKNRRLKMRLSYLIKTHNLVEIG